MKKICLFLIFTCFSPLCAHVDLGIDVFLEQNPGQLLKGKRVGLVTNHTGVNRKLVPTAALLKESLNLVALFSPEHGLYGNGYAWEKISDGTSRDQIPIYSLHGKTRRPTDAMLQGIDILIYDIQDIGVRSYTYATTLFYVMETAAKKQISVIVLDRPNPINGLTVDGSMLDKKWRSYIGYVNVPYCHGMTIGELAKLFNAEYKIGCQLTVIPMRGWKRHMSYKDTGLAWVPTSPHIPEADTPLFYASTGLVGDVNQISHGVGYTLPFKVIGAPWINADRFADGLNRQGMPGVTFLPFHYRPFYGSLKGQDCHGILIRITDHTSYHPFKVQCLLLSMLKILYPEKIKACLKGMSEDKKNSFCKATGNNEIWNILDEESYPTRKMMAYQKKERQEFQKVRAKYLIADYGYCPSPIN